MDDDEWSFEPITDIPGVPTVYDDDPNPVIGVILDHAGDVLHEVHARPVVPFGFCSPRSADSGP